MNRTAVHAVIFVLFIHAGIATAWAAGGHGWTESHNQFPLPLKHYTAHEIEGQSLWEVLKQRATQEPLNIVVTLLFFGAIVHTFLASKFLKISQHYAQTHWQRIKHEERTAEAKPYKEAKDDVCFKATFFHFLGEIEAVFGLWVLPLIITLALGKGWGTVQHYLSYQVNYTEPLFVVVIMAIAASRPVLRFAEDTLQRVAGFGGSSPAAWWLAILTLAPLLGSLITEPAAMTISALLLSKRFYELQPSRRFRYATLGLLFVNISVGGTLTHFAAPPVLIVARPWGWDINFMLMHFGWKAILGITIATGLYFLFFRKELAQLKGKTVSTVKEGAHWNDREDDVPIWVTFIHFGFLLWTVVNAHTPVLFIGGFLIFLAFIEATEHHQNNITLRPALLVGFFLAGLVIHGGCQGWWIAPVLTRLTEWPLMIGATVLTAFNDNAAITYLATQVPGLADSLKYAVVAGAVTGGGLTVIANAPNPAGQSILKKYFDGMVSPLYLALSALIPTVVMGACFMLL